MEGASFSDVKLFNASNHGDIEGVIAALSQGGRVTVRNPQNATPLLGKAVFSKMDEFSEHF